VVHLVDARHPPTKHDIDMVEYLSEVGLPTLVVMTKVDKLKRSEREISLPRTSEALGVDEAQILAFSSKTGEGREALLEALDDLLAPDQDGG
jgi:GTP-binding protein